MPRNRRAAAPDADAQSDAARDLQASTPEATDPAQAKPAPRRRRPRAAAPIADAAEPSAPTAEPPAAPPRRGGRRTKTAITSESTAASQEPVETPAPVAEAAAAPEATPAARRGRGRARKNAADNAPAEAAPAPADPVLPAAAEHSPEAPSSAPADSATALPAPVRGRRRRSQPPATPPGTVLPNVETPLAQTVSEELAVSEAAASAQEAPARRRGGRRRSEPKADLLSVEAELEIPVSDEATEGAAAESEDDSGKRGRRSRRRRRGAHSDVADDVVEGSLLPEETVPETPDDEDLALGGDLIVPEVSRYSAPVLVPPVLAPPDGALLPRVTASIAHPEGSRGLAQIVVNEQAHAPFFFFVNTETAVSGDVVDSQIRAAAAVGIHLYSGVMYLPFKNVYNDRSFGAVDALLQQVLNADPDAYLLPRLQCVPTNYWARTHPDEMARYADGSEGDVSMASGEFWADSVDALEALIAHLSDPGTVGGDRVIGFHLDKGEWFYDREAGYDYSPPNRTAYQNWLHAKYQQPYALRAAWFQGTASFDEAAVPPWTPPTAKPDTMPVYSSRRDQQWPDYAQFASDLVAEAIVGMAAAIKTLSDGRLLVAVSYGYTLEFATRSDSGHLALGKVLESPHVDILAGPNSYTSRSAGSPASFGAPVDSVALHGKLWLVEDDTKTFLAGSETDDVYNPKIAGGADTQAAHQRHFGAALAHRAGVTWMDLWGQGWLDNPDIWRELGGLRDQANRLAQIAPPAPASPDVVAFVDEASLAYLKSSETGMGLSLVGKTRDLLLRTGASVGFYLQSDVTHADLPDAKLYLFLNALRVTTTERLAIREKLQRAGKTLAWVYAAGLFDEQGLSEEEIGETLGMTLRLQPWNSRGGSQISEARHPLLERLRGGKRTIGQDEIINPSYAVTDPQAIVLGEYLSTGAVSLAAREHPAGWKSVFFGDPHLTAELLRGLLTYAGVGLYDTQDDVTYAGEEGVLLVHASFTGQRTLTLPRPATVYDVMEDRIVAANTRSFRVFLRARTSRLFLWGESEAIARATGLSIPGPDPSAPSETQSGGETTFPNEPPDEAQSSPAPTPVALADSAAATLAAAKTMSSLVADMLSPGLSTAPDEQIVQSVEQDYSDAAALAAEIAEEETLPDGDSEEVAGETAASAPRSRWQRRRAAMRARREAERQAQQPSPGAAPASGNAADPMADIAALLPGLPPRRMPPPLRSASKPPQDDAPSDAPAE